MRRTGASPASASAKGLKLAGRLVRQARAHEATVVAALGAADARTLKRLLRTLIEQHADGSPQKGAPDSPP